MAKRFSEGTSASGSGSAPKLDASMRIVILHGSEPYLIREYTHRLAGALDEQFGGLEQFTFDGASVELATVLDELRSYGLMQRHKLVILDNADEFLAERDGANRGPLEAYAKSPVPEATLLMRAESWHPGKLDKAVSAAGGAVVKCEPPPAAKAAGWCVARCAKRYECTIEPAAAERLVQRTGPGLGRLDSELSKLAAFVGPGRTITVATVDEMTQPTREEKAWEIQAALLSGSAAQALQKLGELLDVSRAEPTLVTWAVADLMRKLHTAARLIEGGMPAPAAARQARFFGEAYGQMLEAAQHTAPATLAQLLHRAIDTDWRTKTGQGDVRRSLEGLTVLVTDTMS